MRKIVMMLLVLAMTVCGVIGIAACGKDPQPEQNQGQVEQEKDKDKEEEKNPGQSQGGEKEDEGKGDEENENPNTKPGDTNPPETPENQKPNPENPPEEDPKEDEKQEEEDKKDEEPKEDQDEDKKEEEPPQGDEPEKDPDEGETDPTPGNPTKPDDKPEDKEPEEKPSEPEKKPDDTKPDQENCDHDWVYTVVGEDRNNRMHAATCKKCNARIYATKCTLGESTHVEPTCTEDGYDSYICSVCKQELRAYGFSLTSKNGHKYPATGHIYGDQKWVHVEGTGHTVTATVSQHQKKCTKCDYVLTQECHFTGELIQPTCEHAGENHRTCQECGCKEESSISLEKLEHEWGYKTGTNGNHIKYCTRDCCKNVQGTSEECVFEVTNKTDSTCTKKGTITYKCNKCGATKTETGKGSHTYTKSNFCDVCGQDGLTFGTVRMGLFFNGNAILNNPELKNVKKIYIAPGKAGNRFGIADGAFKEFTELEEVYIPKNVISIASDAFENSGLTKIYFEGSVTEWGNIYADGNTYTFFKDTNKKTDVQVEYDQEATTIKEQWINNKTDTATVFALPAEVGKRMYA